MHSGQSSIREKSNAKLWVYQERPFQDNKEEEMTFCKSLMRFLWSSVCVQAQRVPWDAQPDEILVPPWW